MARRTLSFVVVTLSFYGACAVSSASFDPNDPTCGYEATSPQCSLGVCPNAYSDCNCVEDACPCYVSSEPNCQSCCNYLTGPGIYAYIEGLGGHNNNASAPNHPCPEPASPNQFAIVGTPFLVSAGGVDGDIGCGPWTGPGGITCVLAEERCDTVYASNWTVSGVGEKLCSRACCLAAQVLPRSRGSIPVTVTVDDRARGILASDGPADVTLTFQAECGGPRGMSDPGSICPSPDEFMDVQINHNRPIRWSLEDNEENLTWRCLPRILVQGETYTYRIRISGPESMPQESNGRVRVVARDALYEMCKDEGELTVGCGDCSSGACSSGSESAGTGSMLFRMTLGTRPNGESAGSLYIHESYGHDKIATPLGIRHTLQPGVYRWDSGVNDDFHVRAPTVLAIVEEAATQRVTVSYYTPDQVTNWSSISPGSGWNLDPNNDTPFAEYDIKCEDLALYSEFRITKFDSGVKKLVYDYEYSETTPDLDYYWELTTLDGNGVAVRVERDTWEETSPSKWDHTREITQDGGLYAKTINEYEDRDWGRALITRSRDTGSGSLETQYEYYDSGRAAGRIKSIEYHDGNWNYFEYDLFGRLTASYAPWENSTIADPPNAALARKTEYAYVSHDANDTVLTTDHRPRTVKEYALGTLIAQTRYAYNNEATAPTIVTESGLGAYGAASNLRDVTMYLDPNKQYLDEIHHEDGRIAKYAYDTVTFDGNVPSYSSSPSGIFQLIEITQVNETAPSGVNNKTMRRVVIEDSAGRVVFKESQVKTSGGYVQLDWVHQRLSARGQTVETRRSNGARIEYERDCCNLTSVADEHGAQTDTEHDALGRAMASIKRGVAASGSYAAQADITTTIDFSTASSPSRRVTTTTINGGDPNEALVERTEYDLLGRVVLIRDAANIDTMFEYAMLGAGGWTETQRQPGDANDITTITTYFADGRAKSVTGTGVIERHYDYGVDPNTGWTWTKEWEGGVSSPRWTKTFYNEYGQAVETHRPAFDSASPVITANEYDSFGRLVVTRVTHDGNDLFAPTVIEYDSATGAAFRRGVDLDDNGSLGVSSSEPITESDTAYESYDGGWWQRSRTWVYDEAGTSGKVVTSDVWTRVSGFGASEIAESRSLNPFGAASVSLVTLDRAAALVTEAASPPTGNGSRLAERVTRNGLLQSVKDAASGNPAIYSYDSLGRRVVTSHPRTGDVTTIFDSAGRVVQTFGEDSDTTSYAYNPTTGRLDYVTNALGNATRYAYNDRGDITAVWGAAAQPVTFQYDVYGQRISMTTYRADDPNAWENATFPNPTPIAGDTTELDFDAATGLLEQKVYADSEGPIYTYTPDGRIKTREWARYLDPNTMTPVTTTYEYNGPGGRLSGINYNDPNTPDIAYTYTRFGGLDEVTDAVGTRTFAYDDALSVMTETFDANSIYGAKVLTTDQTDTVASKTVSRLTRVQFGTSGTPNADYEATYAYDPNSGQMTTVMGPGLPNGGATHIWEPNSPGLLKRIDFKQNSTTVASRRYEYLDHRDLLKSLTNEWDAGPTTISKYTYAYDAAGRRTSVVRTGTAFSYTNGPGNHLDLWGYNARNELTSVDRHAGADPNSPGAANNRLDRRYSYDLIGNRISAQNGDLADPNHPGVLYEYVNNQLNQIHRIKAGVSAAQGLKWDVDGNLRKRYLAADLNQNGTVDQSDLAGLLAAYGTCDGNNHWNPDADINGDGCVNLSDHSGLLGLYGQPSLAIEQRWDAENRLVYCGPILPVTGNQRAHYQFDYLGRRVLESVDVISDANDPNLVTWTRVASMSTLWFDGRRLMNFDSLQSNVAARRYLWGAGVSIGHGTVGGTSAMLAVQDAAESACGDRDLLVLYDGLDNVSQLLEVSESNAPNHGGVAGQYEYDVYGVMIGPDMDGDGDWEDDASCVSLNNFDRYATVLQGQGTSTLDINGDSYDPLLGSLLSRDTSRDGLATTEFVFAQNAPVGGPAFEQPVPKGAPKREPLDSKLCGLGGWTILVGRHLLETQYGDWYFVEESSAWYQTTSIGDRRVISHRRESEFEKGQERAFTIPCGIKDAQITVSYSLGHARSVTTSFGGETGISLYDRVATTISLNRSQTDARESVDGISGTFSFSVTSGREIKVVAIKERVRIYEYKQRYKQVRRHIFDAMSKVYELTPRTLPERGGKLVANGLSGNVSFILCERRCETQE